MQNSSDCLRILHVEDNRTDAMLVTAILQQVQDVQFKIHMADNLSDAIKMALVNAYDIVLLDLTLPDSQGLVTLDRFHKRFSHLPVIVLTSVDTKEIIYQAVKRGAQDYLNKSSLNKEVLTRAIRYAIERKQAELDLKASYERFRLIVEGTSDGIWDWQDITQDQQYWSPRLKALLGYADDAIDGSHRLMLRSIHPEDRPKVQQAIREQFEHGRTSNLEFRAQTRHQGYRWFRAKGKTLTDSDGKPVRMVGAISDITQYKTARQEQERLQAQLQQTQKLEAVGQLAAGIAHEINTPIQFVSDHLEFLSDAQQTLQSLLKQYQQAFAVLNIEDCNAQLAQDIRSAEQRANLDFLIRRSPDAYKTIANGMQRVTTIVKAMQRFARSDNGDRVLLDINQTIEDIIIVSGNIWRDNAEIKTELSSDLPKVAASATELNQALLNIMINANQAIEVRRRQQSQHKGIISIHTQQQDQTVKITIADNGIGIADAIRHRVFEPFFTTQDVGQGMGQGLTQAHTIITEQHRGRLWFDSQPQQGTQFYIVLPLPPAAKAATGMHQYA